MSVHAFQFAEGIFGMMCQGNLLGLDANRIYFYSNTLQAIAMGYLIAASNALIIYLILWFMYKKQIFLKV